MTIFDVVIQEESYSTMIPLDPEKLIKDVFPILQKKFKVIFILKTRKIIINLT
jgi:hypothetical protein